MSKRHKANAAPVARDGARAASERLGRSEGYTKRSRRGKPQRSTEDALPASVYVGLAHVGDIEPTGTRWTAITPSGIVLGIFTTRREAVAATAEAPR